jgi:hypothetical protein
MTIVGRVTVRVIIFVDDIVILASSRLAEHYFCVFCPTGLPTLIRGARAAGVVAVNIPTLASQCTPRTRAPD